MSKLWSMTKGARYVDGVLVEEYDHGTKSSMGPTMIGIEDHQAIVAELHIETHEKDQRIAALEAEVSRRDQQLKESVDHEGEYMRRIAALEAQSIAKDERIARLEAALRESLDPDTDMRAWYAKAESLLANVTDGPHNVKSTELP